MSSEEEKRYPRRRRKVQVEEDTGESSSEEGDEDDTSTLSRSVVSGTSRRSELRPQRHRKKTKKRSSRRDSSDDEDYVPRVEMRKDEDGWRKAAPSSGSMLASLLGAPLHRADGFQAQGHPVAQAPTSVTTAVGGSKPQGDSLSRAQRSRLARHGYPTVQLDDSRALQPGNPEMVKYDLELEASDPLALHEITVQFAAFRANTPLKYYLERSTSRSSSTPCHPQELRDLIASRAPRNQVDEASKRPTMLSRLLVRETGRRGSDEPPSSSSSLWCNTGAPNEAQFFAEYLATKVCMWMCGTRIRACTSVRRPYLSIGCCGSGPRSRKCCRVCCCSSLRTRRRRVVRRFFYRFGRAGRVGGQRWSVVGHVQVALLQLRRGSVHSNRGESKENESRTLLEIGWIGGAGRLRT